MMKRYYCKYRGAKTWHVICALNIAAARKKMVSGTSYTLSDVIAQSKEPRTKYPIAGRNTKRC